jgi:hypothetical protein
VREKKGEGGGCRGLLIAETFVGKGLAFIAGRRWTVDRDAVLGEESGPGKKRSLTCGPRMSARGERGNVSLRDFVCWAVGGFSAWAEWLPPRPFFSFFFYFLFLL